MAASKSRPASLSRSSKLVRSPCNASAPGRGSPLTPREKVVTSWPRLIASSTMARPRNRVPPRTRSRMAEDSAGPGGVRGDASAESALLGCGYRRSVRDPLRRRLSAGNVSRRRKGRCRVDRCALFVDAGYVLADGAMAVHGTRHREAVSWDYAGLLQFFGSIARDATGLPLLRCYWYEATVEGRRSAEHDALADLPGIKLRLGRMRPGRREGVESEIPRDPATLARNGSVGAAF